MRSLLMKNSVVIGVSWIAAYIVIILFPLFILLLYPPIPSNERSFLLEFSAALGFIGLAMMAMQFALTARINRIEASYGGEKPLWGQMVNHMSQRKAVMVEVIAHHSKTKFFALLDRNSYK